MIGQTISDCRVVQKLSALARLVLVLLLCVPAFADNDVTLVLGRPMVGSAVGNATYGSSTWDQQQSAKDGLAAGVEFRHWFANHSGFQLDYDRTSTNATFQSFSSDSSVRFPVTRHEMSGAFVRHFGRSESRVHPFFSVGPGILLFNGGSAPGGNVGWSAAFEGILACGVDTPLAGICFSERRTDSISFATRIMATRIFIPGWLTFRNPRSD